MAAPRSAPAVERAAPTNRASIRQQRLELRAQRREQILQQRQQRLEQRQQAQQPSAPAQSRAATTLQSTEANQTRLQTLQSRRGQLSRTERRELLDLRRAERAERLQQRQQATEAQRNTAQPNAARLNAQDSTRLQQLQQQRQQGQLSRTERRELRQLLLAERRQNGQQKAAALQANPQRLQQLQQLARQGQLTREQRRELRQLQRADRLQGRDQRQQQRIAAQQAQQSRFAAARADDGRRGRWAGRSAWRRGLLASFLPWFGPVYWPYAYDDIFYFAFWPGAYSPWFWAYAYDDFFDGIFFPYGGPYANYAYDGPYDGPYARGTVGAAPSRGSPSRPAPAPASAREFCAGQANSVTAWPFAEIERAVQPNADQKTLLDNLKKAAAEAGTAFKEACPENVPMTPPGRLQAMVLRLQATQDAVKTVRPAMEAFYSSLSDDQKERFNEVGPQVGRQRTAARQQPSAQGDCSAAKAGLSNIAVDRIEELVQPTDAQNAGLDRLDDALQNAVDTLSQACPTTTPLTPVGRLEVMEKRLDAMIAAANTVRPALDDFYASLSSEQKAKFNRMGRDTAQSGG